MKGCRVTDAKRLFTSPKVYTKVTAIKKPRLALMATDHMIALGSVSEASRISSAVIENLYQY